MDLLIIISLLAIILLIAISLFIIDLYYEKEFKKYQIVDIKIKELNNG